METFYKNWLEKNKKEKKRAKLENQLLLQNPAQESTSRGPPVQESTSRGPPEEESLLRRPRTFSLNQRAHGTFIIFCLKIYFQVLL